MRKLALAIVLVLVLVGGAVGGMGVATSANGGPTLDVRGNAAPGLVNITGQHWTLGVPVNLWMDTKDDAHHVAVATPNSVGRFVISFLVGPTILGQHHIIGKQGANPDVVAQFTLTSTQQLDDRIWDVLNGMGIEVATIENKLDGIQDDIGVFRSDSGHASLSSNNTKVFDYDGAMNHVSLTIMTSNIDDGDSVKVFVGFGSTPTWGQLANIAINGVLALQFDAETWKIQVTVGSGTVTVDYNVTTTEAYYD